MTRLNSAQNYSYINYGEIAGFIFSTCEKSSTPRESIIFAKHHSGFFYMHVKYYLHSLLEQPGAFPEAVD